jgi:5-methylcytosine-specific restriction protein A
MKPELQRIARIEFAAPVKKAALALANGQCAGCGASLTLNKYHYDHITAANKGGDASLANCQLLCWACHKVKTRKDVADIAKAKRLELRHNGIRKPSRFAGSRDSGLKKKVSGEVVPR